MKTVIHQADGSTQTYSGGSMVSSTPASSNASSVSSNARSVSVSSSSRSVPVASGGSKNMQTIDMNQYTYLSNLAQGNDGNAIWAQNQLANSYVAYDSNQMSYLQNVASGGGGDAAWAQDQLSRAVTVASRPPSASVPDTMGTSSRQNVVSPVTRDSSFIGGQSYPTQQPSVGVGKFLPQTITNNESLPRTPIDNGSNLVTGPLGDVKGLTSGLNVNGAVSLFILFGLFAVISKIFGRRR